MLEGSRKWNSLHLCTSQPCKMVRKIALLSGVVSPNKRLISAVTNDSCRSSEIFHHSNLTALGIHLPIPNLGLTGSAGPKLAWLSEKGSISEKGSVSGRVSPSSSSALFIISASLPASYSLIWSVSRSQICAVLAWLLQVPW